MEMMRERERGGDDARVSNNRLLGERERERERRRERERQINESSSTKTKLKKIERDMVEIRKLAMIYHAKLSNDQKEWTQRLFREIDANGDGKVTVHEFFVFFNRGGSDYLEKLFRFLDKNHNGILDFEDCVTFFYMIASNRLLQCDECGSLLLAAYFLCVECYNANREKTYDLCCSCYSDNNFSHAHSYFLDNYALLLQKEIKNYTPGQADSTRSKLNYTPGQADSTCSKLNYTPGQADSTRSKLNYTPGQADSTRSKLNYNSRQAGGSIRSKTGKIVDLADALSNYDDMAGFVDNMAGLAHTTLSKSGNTSQGSKHEEIKVAVDVFLTGYRILSIASHVPDAAQVVAHAVPAAAHFAAHAVPTAAHFAAAHAPTAAYFAAHAVPACAIM